MSRWLELMEERWDGAAGWSEWRTEGMEHFTGMNKERIDRAAGRSEWRMNRLESLSPR